MDISKTVVGVVGLVVCMLMVAYAAIPTIENAAYEKDYYQNVAAGEDYSLYRYDVQTNAIIEFDGTALKIDGVAVEVPASALVASTNTMRLVYASDNMVLQYLDDGELATHNLVAGDKITLNNGRITYDFAAVDDVTDYFNHTVIVYDPEGDYCSMSSTTSTTATVKYRSMLPMYAATKVTGFLSFAKITDVASGSGEITVTNSASVFETPMTWNASTDDDGVVTITGSPSFTVNENAYAPLIFVPYEYYILVDGDSTNSTLFAVVGTLLIISLVTMAVRLFTGRD